MRESKGECKSGPATDAALSAFVFSHSVVKSVCEKRLEMVVQRGSGYSECCVCKAICYLSRAPLLPLPMASFVPAD